MEKTRPKNSTIKSLSTLSVSCMKIQGGHSLPLPTPMARKLKKIAPNKILLFLNSQ